MKNRKVICLLVIVVIFINLFNVQIFGAATTPVFSVIPNSPSANVGDKYIIKLHVENIQDIYGFEAVVSYDPDKAEFLKDETLAAYGHDEVVVGENYSLIPKIENGKIYIDFTLMGNATPISGNTDFYNLKFKAVGKGMTNLIFDSIKIVDSKQEVQVYTVNSKVSVEHIDKTEPTPEPTEPTPTPNQDDKSKIKTTPVIDSKGIAKAEITAGSLNEAKKNAKADVNGVKKVEVVVQEVTGASEYQLTVPIEAVTSDVLTNILEISTNVATLQIPDNMLLSGLANGASKATFSIAPASAEKISPDDKAKIGNKPVIELKVSVDSKQITWDNPFAPVTVSIDYRPTADELKDPEHIVVWYIDGDGKIVPVPNGRFDEKTGRVVFKITHFSTYAVAYVQKTFSDISGHPWAKKEIEVMASKGVISGTSTSTYTPTADITRADFMVLLVKALGLSAKVDSNFIDIKSTDYYANAVGIAKKLGITSGIGDNKFDPKANITRQDMMVLVKKALIIAGKPIESGSDSDIANYKDVENISGYALDAVSALVRDGIIKGNADMLNPKAQLTRAEAAVVIYKLYNEARVSL